MLKLVLDVVDMLDSPHATGDHIGKYLEALAPKGLGQIDISRVSGPVGSTDFVKVTVFGESGRGAGGNAPTLGIIGRLGGVGARPERIGLVSDGDGAAVAITAAAKLLVMAGRGDRLAGDVMVATHICPNAPIAPHEPVAFMGSPIDMETMNRHEVSESMDALVVVDTTRGNRIINHRGLALSPTVKQGYILRVSPRLGELLEIVTGVPLVTYPVTVQDIVPYEVDVHHINSILQPATATAAPVIGLAITSAVAIPGAATGATQEHDVEAAARYVVEVAKEYGRGLFDFYDRREFEELNRRYGSMSRLQTRGRSPESTNHADKFSDDWALDEGLGS